MDSKFKPLLYCHSFKNGYEEIIMPDERLRVNTKTDREHMNKRKKEKKKDQYA